MASLKSVISNVAPFEAKSFFQWLQQRQIPTPPFAPIHHPIPKHSIPLPVLMCSQLASDVAAIVTFQRPSGAIYKEIWLVMGCSPLQDKEIRDEYSNTHERTKNRGEYTLYRISRPPTKKRVGRAYDVSRVDSPFYLSCTLLLFRIDVIILDSIYNFFWVFSPFFSN